MTIVVLSTLWLGTCMAVAPFMDLPPGDWYSPTIHNDTSESVQIVQCANDDCSRRDSGSDNAVVIGPGRTSDYLLADAHGGTVFAVLTGSGEMVGCLVPDSDPTGMVEHPRRLDVSSAARCGIATSSGPGWVLPVAAVSLAAGTSLAAVQVVRLLRRRRARLVRS
jgi:hypothetical protein